MWHVWGDEREVHTGFWWENLRQSDNLEGVGVAVRITLTWILRKLIGRAWIEFVWRMFGTSGGLL
jgi:hypothetical protein